MIVIPQRLFGNPQVKVLLREGNVCILEKQLTEPVLQREGYISNHVISILLAGQQQITTYEQEHIKVNPGEILFIPRGLYHITDLLPAEGSFHSLLFYFDDAIIKEFLSNVRVGEVRRTQVPEFLKLGVNSTIQLFADSLIQIYQANILVDKSLLKIKMLELLHLISALITDQKFAEFLFQLSLPQKRNIQSFIDHNYDKPLKIEDYAYLTGRSVSTFRRDFKEQYDSTPKKWLKKKRIEKALEIIQTQNISVTQLAYEVGYENISYFIAAFKSQVGLSPKQYILSINKNNLSN